MITKSVLGNGRAILMRYASTKATAASAPVKEKWDIYAGVLVERLPVITKTMAPIEAKFKVSIYYLR